MFAEAVCVWVGREVTPDGGTALTGAWSIWSGSYLYSSCSETRFLEVDQETFTVSQLSKCDALSGGVVPLGDDICGSTLQLERRVNNGP